MSDTPRTDEIWGSMHGSGYQMMILLARKLERELAALQKECGTAIRRTGREIAYREMAEKEADKWLRLSTEWSEANEQAEKELAEVKRERDKHFAASKSQNEDITALQAELATCKADAERYRWLRDMNNDDAAMRCVQLCGAAMDEAIDEAIKGSAT